MDTQGTAGLRARLEAALGGAYTLEREFGGGGMSRVFLATDARLGRHVVVKVLAPELAAGVSAARFEREILLAARLQHPHVLPVHAAGDVGGLPYYTMPYVEGESLRQRLTREGALPVADAVRLVRELADALAYAHAQGVVHRDLKPENVLLSGGHAVVADFGIAKALAAATLGAESGTSPSTTALGHAIGTPAYMAPEQAAGDPDVDERADLYALGLIAYELLAGRHPFADRRTPQALVAAQLVELPPPLAVSRPDVPPALRALVLRCLEKRPADRPQRADDVLRALDAVPTSGTHASAARRRPLMIWSLVGAVVALGALGAVGVYAARPHGALPADPAAREEVTPASALPARAPRSIAVLPMVNTSGDPANEHLSDGLTDELIGALSKVDSLRVTGRTSSFALRGKGLDVRAIAETLGVATVLEGSLRRTGDRLKVGMQLVNADGSVRWSEAYDRTLSDLFAVQEEIARAVVHALRLELGTGRAPLVGRAPSDLAAYDLYLKGRFFRRRQTPDDLRRAIGYFERAVARDSTDARAYAGLSDAHFLLAVFASRPAAEAVPRARAFGARALALDETLAEGHWTLAQVLFGFDYDWAAAGRHFERALALDPGNVEARHLYAIYLLDQRRFDEAALELTRTLAADPLYPNPSMTLGRVYLSTGDPARAIPHLQAALELAPAFSYARQQLGYAYLQQGRHAEATTEFERAAATGGASDSAALAYAHAVAGRRPEARAILGRLLAPGRGAYVPPFHVAMAYVGLGEADAAFRWLERAFREHDVHLTGLAVVPAFEPLRVDPRFARLVRRIGLGP